MHGSQPEFRVRSGNQILGYAREISGREWFSSDGLWWRGEKLVAAGEVDETDWQRDACTSWRDANNRWVFSHDVLNVVWRNPFRGKWTAVVSFTADGHVLEGLSGRRVNIEELAFAKSFEVISHDWLL